MTLRCAVYARVSSAAQRDRDTIAAQLRDLPAFAARHGWTVVVTEIDDGKSAAAGKLDARDGLARLLAGAARGAFDIVVVSDIDRLTRSADFRERGAILGAFQVAGIKVACALTGQIHDGNTEMGDLTISLGAFFAAAENRKRRERVLAGQQLARDRGGKGCGHTPFGLTYAKVDGRHVWGLDPERAPILREIFERVANRESCLRIAEDFEDRELARAGKKPWTRHRVWELAASSTHATGAWKVRGGAQTIAVPAIVTPELVARARAALEVGRKSGLDRTWHVYLLAKLSRCGSCGQAIRVRSGGNYRKGRKVYAHPFEYRCVGRWSPLPPGVKRCAAPGVEVHNADERAWAAICRELADPALVPALVAIRAERSTDRRDFGADVAGYEKHLARLTAAEVDTLNLLHRGKASAAAVEKSLAKLHREREMVTEQLRFAERARGRAVLATQRLCDAEAIVAGLRDRLATATPIERREIVATLVDPGGVVLDGASIRIEMWVERPVVERRDGLAAMVTAQPWLNTHDSHLRIRLVAKLSAA